MSSIPTSSSSTSSTLPSINMNSSSTTLPEPEWKNDFDRRVISAVETFLEDLKLNFGHIPKDKSSTIESVLKIFQEYYNNMLRYEVRRGRGVPSQPEYAKSTPIALFHHQKGWDDHANYSDISWKLHFQLPVTTISSEELINWDGNMKTGVELDRLWEHKEWRRSETIPRPVYPPRIEMVWPKDEELVRAASLRNPYLLKASGSSERSDQLDENDLGEFSAMAIGKDGESEIDTEEEEEEEESRRMGLDLSR